MRRAYARRCLVVLAVSLALPASLLSMPDLSVQASQTPGDRADEYKSELRKLENAEASLRSQAKAARNELVVGTAKWNAAKKKLVAAKKDAAAKAKAAKTAKQQVAEKRRVVAQLVASTYQSPLDSSTALAAGVSDGDPLAQARGMADIDQVYDQQAAKLETFEAEQIAADVFARQARRAERKAASLETSLQQQTVTLRAKAKKSTGLLTKAVEKVDTMAKRVRALEAKERKRLAKIAAKKRAKRAKELGGNGGGGGGGGGGGSYLSCHKSSRVNYPNGLIPTSALCPLPQGGYYLRADAARAFYRLNAAYRGTFGSDICVNSAYRPLWKQQQLYATMAPGYAAVPGTSNHGLGQAVDMGCGVSSFGTAQHNWMRSNGPRFGWHHPAWARGSIQEPWHFEYWG